MTRGVPLSESQPDIRLLWSDELPDELRDDEIRELQDDGFILRHMLDPAADTIGTKSIAWKTTDEWAYFAIRRTPILKLGGEDDNKPGAYFGLISSIETDTTESYGYERTALCGLLEEFRRRRGV